MFAEIQPNLLCELLHEWHVLLHILFWSPPPEAGGGTKRSNIIKFQLQSQFQIFLNHTLCNFSRMNDIKHIRRGFHSVAWVVPQGWYLGMLGVKN